MNSLSRKPDLYRRVLHPSISVAVATTFMLALMALGARFLGTGGPAPLVIIFVILAPLIEAFVGNLLYAERAGMGNRARELVIFLMVVYVVFSLVRPGPLLAGFVPSPSQLLPVLAAAFTWLHAFDMHNRLRGREGLLRLFHGKQGESLRHALIDRQHDMALTVRELRGVRSIVAAGFIVLAMIAIVTGTGMIMGSTLPVDSAAFVLLCLNGIAAIIVIGMLNGFIDEYAANGIGLGVPFRFQRRRLVASVVVVLAAVAGAFALSRGRSLLPLEAIGAFFRWIGSLFDRDGVPAEPPPLPRFRSPPPGMRITDLLPEMEPVTPPLWLRMLVVLMRRLAVAVAAGAIAVLIFGPLFSPAFRAGLAGLRPRAMLREFAGRVARQIRILLRWLNVRLFFRHGIRGGIDVTAPRQTGAANSQPRRWRPSLSKRRQMGRVVAVFSAIAEWGAQRGLTYRPSEGAREFLSRVARKYPELDGEAVICGDVFWEARYSRHMLRRSRIGEYVRASKRITATG